MIINRYQQLALRTENKTPTYDLPNGRLIQGLMGLNGEAGECIDILKKHLFQGHELDREHLAKELGDVGWYLALCADALGYGLDEIFEMNLNKLHERYPEGYFNAEQSIERSVDDV